MDPLSVLSGVIGIVLGAAHVARRLSDLHGSYTNAPRSVRFLIDECFAISGALSQLQGWICHEDQGMGSNRQFVHIDMLVNTVDATRRTFNELQAETEKLEGIKGKMPMGVGVRYLWREDSIRETLVRLQSHKTGLTLILTVLQSQSNAETQNTLKEMMNFMRVMSNDQQRMWKALKRADILSADDGRSLFTTAESIRRTESSEVEGVTVDMKGFTFDEELMQSTVYRGVKGPDDVLTMADVSDISSLALPDHDDGFKDEKKSASYVLVDTEEAGPSTEYEQHDHPPAYARSPPLPNSGVTPSTLTPPRGEPQTVDLSLTQHISPKTVLSWLGPRHIDDWDTFWKVAVSKARSGEPQRQRVIHRTLCDEIDYFKDLHLFRESYSSSWAPYAKVLGQQTAAKVFGDTMQPVIDRLLVLAELQERLLLPMLTRAAEAGPYVPDLTGIYREWLRDAEAAYVEYCSAQAGIEHRISAAAEKYLPFQQYVTGSQRDGSSRRLGLSEFVVRPVTRVVRQHYHWHSVNLHTADPVQSENERELISELHAAGMRIDKALGEGRYQLFNEILKNGPKDMPDTDLIHLRSELRTMNWIGEGVLISGMLILFRVEQGNYWCELSIDINDPTFSVARDPCTLNFSTRSLRSAVSKSISSSASSAQTLWEGPKPVSVVGDKKTAQSPKAMTDLSLSRRASVGPAQKQASPGFEVRYQGETYQFGVGTSRVDTRDRWVKELRMWSGQAEREAAAGATDF